MWPKSLVKFVRLGIIFFLVLGTSPARSESAGDATKKPSDSKAVAPLSSGLPAETTPGPEGAANGASTSEKELTNYISPLEFGLDIEYGSVKYPNYLFGPGVGAPDSGSAIFVNFEWMVLKTVGKLGLGLEVGAFVLPNEQVVPAPPGGYNLVSTLYTFPVNAMVTYRFDYMDNNEQILVPFVKAGPGVAVSSQRSPSSPQWGRSGLQRYVGFNYGAGLEIGLNWIDQNAATSLDHSIGINATYLVLEYVRSAYITGNVDLTSQQLRAGLRFEM